MAPPSSFTHLLYQSIPGTASLSGRTSSPTPPRTDTSASAGKHKHLTRTTLKLSLNNAYVKPRWLDAKPGVDTSHCSARPNQIDWFEYTPAGNCTATECRVHAVNYLVEDPTKPSFASDYVASALDLGNGDAGRLALSYFDKLLGGYAVGSRNVLSGDLQADARTVDDCHAAFETLQNIQQRWNIRLPFELENPCMRQSGRLQFPMRGDL